MSDTDVTAAEPTGDDVTLRREVLVRIDETGDGRTLESRLVPYNEVATVNDGAGDYQEMFLPGAFNKQMRAANRIKAFLNFRHGRSLQDVIGHATKIEDKEDGLHGALRVLENPDGDKALQLIEAGELNKLSIEFRPLREKIVDGVVHRLAAQLLGVALVPEGAYVGAEVLAVREEPPQLVGVEKPDPLSEEMLERLQALGIDTLLRAFTTKPWSGAASKYADTAAYCSACLIDDNPAGAEKTQAKCHLPIKEPNGDININAVRNALARVGQVQTSAENKAAARRRLQQLLAQFNSKSGGRSAPLGTNEGVPMAERKYGLLTDPKRVAMPEGMSEMPAGVKACSMNGTPGYSGGGACHMHDGSDASMKAAMDKAMKDVS